MTIEHIPPNDWATVGARLERLESLYSVSIYQYNASWAIGVAFSDFRGFELYGYKTPLEALTAALDAAEGKSCQTNDPV